MYIREPIFEKNKIKRHFFNILKTGTSDTIVYLCVFNNFTNCGSDQSNKKSGDFSGGLVVKTLSFQCRECRFDPWSGN